MYKQVDYDYMFKLLVIGDVYDEKSAFLNEYVDNEWRDSNVTTIGVDFVNKIIIYYIYYFYRKLKILKLKEKV